MATRQKSQIKGMLGGLGLLAIVGYLDVITGYKVSVLIFYLAPIIYVFKRAGLHLGFVMTGLAALVWLFADIYSGDTYSNFINPLWNAGIRLSIFLLVLILLSSRDQLQRAVEKRTEDLRHEMAERSRLEKELLAITENEQRRIGRDLHDSLGQQLTAIALGAKIISKKVANKSAIEPASVERLVSIAEDSIEMTRRIARNLDPVEFGTDGLAMALSNLAIHISQTFNINCKFESSETPATNEPQTNLHLYRIVQEAVSNAIRHGQARNVIISLDSVRNNLLLAVTDDGQGMSATSAKNTGMGLRIMKYRAGIIGGIFEIQNLPAGGTRAVCILNHNVSPTDQHDLQN